LALVLEFGSFLDQIWHLDKK